MGNGKETERKKAKSGIKLNAEIFIHPVCGVLYIFLDAAELLKLDFFHRRQLFFIALWITG